MSSMIGLLPSAPGTGRSTRPPGSSGGAIADAPDGRDTAHDRSLSRLIASEIIPRLMLAHAVPDRATPIATGEITADEVARFAPLTLQIEADALLDHVEDILGRGVPIETLLVDLLAPAARLLGEYWESDRCDFVDVTMGLWRLQEVVHELSTRMPADHRPELGGRRALFASMPGDQHSFGTVVVDELFCREGWLTDRIAEVDRSILLGRISDEWFDLIGLTISCDCHIASLPSMILALRTVSKNPRICVMVGGRVFGVDPGLAVAVGADGTAPDARLAVEMAGTLVAAVQRGDVY